MMELIERRVVASQKVGVCLYFSQIDLVILILVPFRRNDQPLVLVGNIERGILTPQEIQHEQAYCLRLEH